MSYLSCHRLDSNQHAFLGHQHLKLASLPSSSTVTLVSPSLDPTARNILLAWHLGPKLFLCLTAKISSGSCLNCFVLPRSSVWGWYVEERAALCCLDADRLDEVLEHHLRTLSIRSIYVKSVCWCRRGESNSQQMRSKRTASAIGLRRRNQCLRRDSNPRWTRFKLDVSADWTTKA